jgi:flagellar biosynthesis component FlhA
MELAEMSIRQMLSLNLVTAAAILLIWYLSHLAEMAKWKQQRQDEAEERRADREERERQAREHMIKWESMVQQSREELERQTKNHNQDTERLMKLLERQTNINELHASLLQNINLKIDQIKNLK